MGYYNTPGPGSNGHTHANHAVLDQITDPGSGQVITDAERQKIGAYADSGGSSGGWTGTVPATTDEAIARIARVLTQHLGTTIPPLDQ